MSSYSVKMITRRVVPLAGVPARAGRSGHMCSPDPVDQACGRGHRAGRGPPRRSRSSRRGAAARGRTASGRGDGRRVGAWPPRSGRPPRPAAPRRVSVARSSSASTPPASRSNWPAIGRGRPASPLGCFPVPLDGPAVDAEGAGERLDRRQQALLQARDQEAGRRLLALRSRPSAAPRAARRYSSSRAERRSSGASAGRPSMSICTTLPLREARPTIARRSSLSRRTITSSSTFCALDGHAAAEPLRVEDLEQGGEAVRVAVVRRGREEQPVLEARGQVADGPGDLRVDGVVRAARGRGVVGLVEDQQRAGPEVAEPVAQRGGVRLRRSAARARPGTGVWVVHGLTPKPRSRRDAGDVVLVEDLEDQAEAALQLVLPLQEHDGGQATTMSRTFLRSSSSRAISPASIVLPRPDVVGDEQVHPRQAAAPSGAARAGRRRS